jgi:fructosamine-3-kinase
MSEAILASKLANALFAGARPSVTDIYGAIESATEQQRRIHGGLWVGGTAVLTKNALRFTP